ncbi:Zinc finger CCCH domain-containing protein 3 [Frankliniella fusca]|uniref:Zinc finger CCCH domain-containing protein 3 n=1 Tax=Frankliniella fusca TaxID=407009 RepID=A0AAE1H1F4_9NEOP|nr:Zinc finger CCCH domain-containing protein 3 [Frankliniella fusca]
MDNAFSGSYEVSQGRSVNVGEGGILLTGFHCTDVLKDALKENYGNSQEVDDLSPHSTYHHSSKTSSATLNQSDFGVWPSTCNATSRVHINPNFRPKPSMGIEKCQSRNQHSRVHINPHWRGRVEAPLETTVKPMEKILHTSCSNNSGKTTIFVNPKVLPHLRLEALSYSDVDGSLPNHQEVGSQRRCEQSTNTLFEGSLSESLQKNVLVQECREEPAKLNFGVDDSSTLIYKANQMYLGNESDQNSRASSSMHTKTIALSKSGTGCFNNNCSTKLAGSKYRLVRNSSSNLKMSQGSSGGSLKRSRKRTENLPISTSKSIYKFVRDEGFSNSASNPSDTINMNYIGGTKSSQPERRGDVTNSQVKKNIKSQYKHIKIPLLPINHDKPQPTISKPKTVHSRFKLIRTSPSNKLATKRSAAKKFVATVPGVPLQSQVIKKSHFKILRTSLGNGTNLARRVSRFRIVSASSIFKPQARRLQSLVRFSRDERPPNLNSLKFKKFSVYGNISWKNDKCIYSSGSVLKLPTTGSSQTSKTVNAPMLSKPSNRSVVNIGGVLYRSTRTSLTRTHSNESKEQILNIRGKKYVLDGKGTVLRPKCDPGDVGHVDCAKKMKASISRVDIGGVTFTRRSDNTLVRTNSHFARNLVSLAKMKSIAFLRGKHRKINQPCLIYHRFGKCHAHDAGKCWRVHNPKYISICKKFLQGNCEAEKCLLSHDVGPEKMPTCHYFLEGCCVRDNCPYLHVKLSSHAAICREFLNGYCAAGDTCKKRHIFLCPDFEQFEKCSKGKYCPYPHKTTPKISIQSGVKDSTKKSCRKKKAEKIGLGTDTSGLDDSEKRMRYYDESKKQTVDQTISNEGALANDFEGDDLDQTEGKNHAQIRTKLGILPAYIPLE